MSALQTFVLADSKATASYSWRPYEWAPDEQMCNYTQTVVTRHARRLTLSRSAKHGFVASIARADGGDGRRIYIDLDGLTQLRDALNDFIDQAKEAQ